MCCLQKKTQLISLKILFQNGAKGQIKKEENNKKEKRIRNVKLLERSVLIVKNLKTFKTDLKSKNVSKFSAAFCGLLQRMIILRDSEFLTSWDVIVRCTPREATSDA